MLLHKVMNNDNERLSKKITEQQQKKNMTSKRICN